MSETLVPAAQYLRMSMDDQPNSIAFQQEAIRCHAVLHNFKIVATFADLGKSGLEIKHRSLAGTDWSRTPVRFPYCIAHGDLLSGAL
jgi:Resolvase, N terminal domain